MHAHTASSRGGYEQLQPLQVKQGWHIWTAASSSSKTCLWKKLLTRQAWLCPGALVRALLIPTNTPKINYRPTSPAVQVTAPCSLKVGTKTVCSWCGHQHRVVISFHTDGPADVSFTFKLLNYMAAYAHLQTHHLRPVRDTKLYTMLEGHVQQFVLCCDTFRPEPMVTGNCSLCARPLPACRW